MTKQWLPQEVSGFDCVFGGNIRELLPAMNEIPDEFKRTSNPYAKLVGLWFFNGLAKSALKAKQEIDATKAFNHMQAIMVSFDPQHEHKIAGVAYLMSLWFDIAITPEQPKVTSKNLDKQMKAKRKSHKS